VGRPLGHREGSSEAVLNCLYEIGISMRSQRVYMYVCMYQYIYIYRERERDSDIHIARYIYIYLPSPNSLHPRIRRAHLTPRVGPHAEHIDRQIDT